MDALMAALVAALLATVPDRAALIAASSARPARTIALALMAATVAALAATGLGIILAPRLAPAARLLMLAVALMFIGVEFLVRRLPSPPYRGSVVAAVGSAGLWFVVLTLAMRSALPWLAVPGALIGVSAPLIAAAMLDSDWRRLPLGAIRRVTGALFTIVAAILACRAIGIA